VLGIRGGYTAGRAGNEWQKAKFTGAVFDEERGKWTGWGQTPGGLSP
jgi:hypothetical protein